MRNESRAVFNFSEKISSHYFLKKSLNYLSVLFKAIGNFLPQLKTISAASQSSSRLWLLISIANAHNLVFGAQRAFICVKIIHRDHVVLELPT